ncbi:hypothetical protein A9Q86_09860 [Flavobacteriales bacterium 33_180_T64]|nr:hypothetical protein A9Q86_09860 [Flavobacteriales bacterium 33_180_T64]
MKKSILIVLIAFGFNSFSQAQGKQNNKTNSNNTLNLKKMNDQKNETQSFNEYQEVLKALQPYIKSAKTGDGKLSRSAFYDHADIIGSMNGKYIHQTADQFGKDLSSFGASENVQHHVAWIDISGPAAAAKVEFIDWLGFRFTDFFVLYKKNGEWKISGKVYDSHSQN